MGIFRKQVAMKMIAAIMPHSAMDCGVSFFAMCFPSFQIEDEKSPPKRGRPARRVAPYYRYVSSVCRCFSSSAAIPLRMLAVSGSPQVSANER